MCGTLSIPTPNSTLYAEIDIVKLLSNNSVEKEGEQLSFYQVRDSGSRAILEYLANVCVAVVSRMGVNGHEVALEMKSKAC